MRMNLILHPTMGCKFLVVTSFLVMVTVTELLTRQVESVGVLLVTTVTATI